LIISEDREDEDLLGVHACLDLPDAFDAVDPRQSYVDQDRVRPLCW